MLLVTTKLTALARTVRTMMALKKPLARMTYLQLPPKVTTVKVTVTLRIARPRATVKTTAVAVKTTAVAVKTTAVAVKTTAVAVKTTAVAVKTTAVAVVKTTAVAVKTTAVT